MVYTFILDTFIVRMWNLALLLISSSILAVWCGVGVLRRWSRINQRDKSICICARERVNSKKRKGWFYLGAEYRWHINPRCCRRWGEMESMGRKLGPRAPYVPHLSGFLPTHFHPFYLRLCTGWLRKVVGLHFLEFFFIVCRLLC